jgi:hypothetical protein
MAKYIKNFVTGHGISFERNKRNIVALEKSTELWAEISANLVPDVVLICGAKNNGKSSLMRFLVNEYNRQKPRRNVGTDIDMIDGCDVIEDGRSSYRDRYAYLVDFDPGQAEMTSPGIISAHIIRATAQPLESPSYLNMGQHESVVMSSVGGTNMSVNPKMFIENCRFVYNKVLEHRSEQPVKRPIFINTMGHIRNVGLAMLMDVIKICRPTQLIVLNVESDPMRTIYADLSPAAIDSTRASFYYEANQQSQPKLDYKCDIYNLQFMFIDSSSVANKNRVASQLAYMATIPESLYKPIMQLNTKWLSLKKISVYCVSSYPLKEGIVLELLHHSWIHLIKLRKPPFYRATSDMGQQATNSSEETVCKIIDDVSENTLFGCGIVAEIDLEKRLLAIITPLDQATLDNSVDCIIKPLSIQVPHQMIGTDF